MKKLLPLLLAVLVVCATACTKKADDKKEEENKDTPTTEENKTGKEEVNKQFTGQSYISEKDSKVVAVITFANSSSEEMKIGTLEVSILDSAKKVLTTTTVKVEPVKAGETRDVIVKTDLDMSKIDPNTSTVDWKYSTVEGNQ